MKILVYTPFWKRPEIVALYLQSYKRLRKYANIQLFAVLSPEDPHYENIAMQIPGHAYVRDYQNKPLGAKKNYGLKVASTYEWDYLLELNSDSMVNPALLDLYRPYMDKKVPFFGLNNLYAVDFATKKTIFLPDYNCGMSYGAGQMLHRDALKGPLWTDELNEGMDTDKIKRLRSWGIQETVVDCGTTPMIVDLKTNTTITHFKFMERRGEEVDYEIVKDVVTCN